MKKVLIIADFVSVEMMGGDDFLPETTVQKKPKKRPSSSAANG
jgi:hypothetical protein